MCVCVRGHGRIRESSGIKEEEYLTQTELEERKVGIREAGMEVKAFLEKVAELKIWRGNETSEGGVNENDEQCFT